MAHALSSANACDPELTTVPLSPRNTYRRSKDRASAQGVSGILAIVAVAVLIIVGIVYVWQPGVEQIASR